MLFVRQRGVTTMETPTGGWRKEGGMQQTQQCLILADGFELPHVTKQQLANVRTFIDQMARDPRVKSVYGTNGRGAGCALWCDLTNMQEADRIAAMAHVYGLSNVQIINLTPADQLRLGIQEAERFANPEPVLAGTASPSGQQPAYPPYQP